MLYNWSQFHISMLCDEDFHVFPNSAKTRPWNNAWKLTAKTGSDSQQDSGVDHTLSIHGP